VPITTGRPGRKGSQMPITTATRHTTSGPGRRPVTEPARAPRPAQRLMPRWLAGRRRFAGVTLAATGLAVTFAATIAGSGHLGRGAAAQIGFAATVTIFAIGEALRSPAGPVSIDDRTAPGAARRRKRLGTFALVAGGLLGLTAGGAALGAGWGTTLLTTLAVACAVASIAAPRPAAFAPAEPRRPQPGAHRPV
jgi:hypothetical protein